MRTSIQKECFKIYRSATKISETTNDTFIRQMILEIVERIESICERERELIHNTDWEWLKEASK